jgi:hypothetical protein
VRGHRGVGGQAAAGAWRGSGAGHARFVGQPQRHGALGPELAVTHDENYCVRE